MLGMTRRELSIRSLPPTSMIFDRVSDRRHEFKRCREYAEIANLTPLVPQCCSIMWNEPPQTELLRLPSVSEIEQIPAQDRVICMHLFLKGSSWYLAGYDSCTRTLYGYIIRSNAPGGSWARVSYDELRETRSNHGLEIDRDLGWRPRTAFEVERIKINVSAPQSYHRDRHE